MSLKSIEEIEIGKEYSLDLGSLTPVKVKVLEILNEKEILVEYLYSWSGRQEILTIDFF